MSDVRFVELKVVLLPIEFLSKCLDDDKNWAGHHFDSTNRCDGRLSRLKLKWNELLNQITNKLQLFATPNWALQR